MRRTKNQNIIGSKYKVFRDDSKLLGEGSFGRVYIGQNIKSGVLYAVKTEERQRKDDTSLLEVEANIISYANSHPSLNPEDKFIQNYWYGQDRYYRYLVTDLLSDNLSTLATHCGGHLSLKTVLMLADQMIQRVQYYHDRHIIHRDLKPDNFLLDRSGRFIYLIDFGLAKKFRNRASDGTYRHIDYNRDSIHVGTVRYMSCNAHLKCEQSRRDDMYSLGYVLLSLLNDLPWQKIDEPTKTKRYQRVLQLKQAYSNQELGQLAKCSRCQANGEPCVAEQVFEQYFDYIDTVDFQADINYNFLTKLFLDCMVSHEFQYDKHWDWLG